MGIGKIMDFNQLIEQIKPAMEKMAEQLGVGAEFLWQVLLKQQLVDGFIAIGGMVLGIVIIGFLVFILKKLWKNVKKEEREDAVVALILIFILPVMLSVFFICFSFVGAINHFINPEYQAIKDIFEFINGNITN